MSEDIDFIHRILCPSGDCIGVLDLDGSCRECGRVDPRNLADPRVRSFRADEELESDIIDEEDAHKDEFVESLSDRAESGKEDAPRDDPMKDRTLCPDGSCIGVIGDDGACKECGIMANE